MTATNAAAAVIQAFGRWHSRSACRPGVRRQFSQTGCNDQGGDRAAGVRTRRRQKRRRRSHVTATITGRRPGAFGRWHSRSACRPEVRRQFQSKPAATTRAAIGQRAFGRDGDSSGGGVPT